MKLGAMIDAFRPADGPPPHRLGAFFLWCLSGAWPALTLASVVSALAGTFEVISAVMLGKVIDVAQASPPAEVFSRNAVLLIGFLLFYVVLRPLVTGLNSATVSMIIQPNVLPLTLSRLHRWTLGQSITFFDNDFAGRIAQKQMQAARAITDVTTEAINAVVFAATSVIGSIFFLLAIDYRIALGLTIWMLGYALLIKLYLPEIRDKSAKRAGARAMVTGQVVDTITNIKTVKLFAHDAFEDRAALTAMEGFRERALEFGRVSAFFRFALMTLAGILPVLLVGMALFLWSRGAATTGDIVAAGAISLRIAQMSGWVSMTLMSIWGSIGEAEDGMNTLAAAHTLTDALHAVRLTRVGGDVVFDNLSFAYGRRTGGVEGINLHIKPGEKIGIVGASGAGKSTLVALLLRLYDAETGRILIDGQDVREVTQESLRRQIAMVTQETAMFNRSARANILYGRPDATEDEVIAAAKKAEAHEFILGMADHMGRKGYDAYLGERGVKLSGGQRQRIALARAFLKDAPILVLDEATSALDSEVEASIQSALGRVMEDKTVLAIAHRLSTIAEMDRIVVLDGGHIVEEGSHDMLLASRGRYWRYWTRQSGGFLGTEEAAE